MPHLEEESAMYCPDGNIDSHSKYMSYKSHLARRKSE